MSRIEKALEKAALNRNTVSAEDAKSEVESVRSVKKELIEPVGSIDKLVSPDPLVIDNPMLVAMRNKDDAIAEEFRKLRSIVLKLTKSETFKNTLMVTSTVSGEGKTLIALNLAIALAKEYDHTVLLVDTDLRRPSVHKYLGIEPEAGLIHYLKGQSALDDVLVKTGIGKLVVLPAGGVLDDPVEFLSSNRMKQVVGELKNRYPDRYVIFDTPPMLPFADAQVLKDSVDATIFVVRERKVKLEHVKKMINTLKDSNLLGVVYNDIQLFSTDNPYYDY